MVKKWLRKWLGLDDTDRKLALLIQKEVRRPDTITDSPVVSKGYTDAGVRRPAGRQ